MLLWFKGDYDFNYNEERAIPSIKNLTFINTLKNGHKISINIDYEYIKIEAKSQYEISQNLYTWILADSSIKQVDIHEDTVDDNENDAPPELKQIILDLDESKKRVLSIIKYVLNDFHINDDLLLRCKIEWSKDNLEYKAIKGSDFWGGDWAQVCLNIENNEKNIQEYLDNGFYPFVALKFLHRAINENNSNFKMIDATIAAEMAIKEFLIRKNNDLRPLLLELNAPPLSKLYGTILKYFASMESPQKDILVIGSEIRNILIHAPNEIEIPYDLSEFYCHNVQLAIYHLLHILYPEDKIIKILLNSPVFYYSDLSRKRNKNALNTFYEDMKKLKRTET
jgi:hypothetical protein